MGGPSGHRRSKDDVDGSYAYLSLGRESETSDGRLWHPRLAGPHALGTSSESASRGRGGVHRPGVDGRQTVHVDVLRPRAEISAGAACKGIIVRGENYPI